MVPYMHIQEYHDLQMTRNVRNFTLGWLSNGVMEHKHREMKILNNNQGGGRRVLKEYRNTIEHDKIFLLNNMQARFFKLVMRLEGNFQNLK